MDDMDDPTFSEGTQGQSSFILLPSQEETQPESQVDEQMVKYLRRLPALQKAEEEERVRVLLGNTSTDEEQGKGKAAVMASDTDSMCKTDVTTGPSDYVSESDSEADVTVIRKKSPDDGAGRQSGERQHSDSSNGSLSNGSSFKSKNRSNLGSYDQCEVYKTQQGHVKGDRFAASQDDMFAETEERFPVATPAEHLGSLQFSQKPMLVPETVEESLDEIPPSPGVLGSTPIIIPSSPTLERESVDSESGLDETNGNVEENQSREHQEVHGEASQSMFDVNAGNTLASHPEVGETLDSNQEAQQSQPSEDPSVPENGKSESLHLHLSESTLKSGKSQKDEGESRIQQRRRGVLRTPLSSQKLHGGVTPSEEPEVIIIDSGSFQQPIEVEESQDYSLRMTPSQSRSTQGRRSTQGQRSQYRDKSDDIIEENIAESEDRAVLEPANTGKQLSDSDINKDKELGAELEEFGERQRHTSGSLPHPDSRPRSQGPQSLDRTSQGDTRSESERKQAKHARRMQKINNGKPLVEWATESDTESEKVTQGKSSARFSDEFHISVPRTDDGGLGIEEKFIDTSTQPQAAQSTYREKTLPDTVLLTTSAKEPRNPEPVDEAERCEADRELITPEPDVQHLGSGSGGQKLSLRMIRSESENTEAVFKLQKPEVEESNVMEETEEVFPKTRKKHPRYIQDDSDEEISFKLPDKDNSDDSEEEILFAEKLHKQVPESADQTLSYDADTVIDKETRENTEAAKQTTEDEVNVIETNRNTPTVIKNVRVGENLEAKDNVQSEVSAQESGRVRRLTESSTQTQDKEVAVTPFESVDINVVQKVAEYLQSGYSPRSRTSSTCTDQSDPHGDGSEKGDSGMKTPKVKHRHDKTKTPARSPKSPQEIKDIIKTYSDIIQKKHQQKLKYVDDKTVASSQKPNPTGGDYDKAGKLEVRRLSSQSLPEELLRARSAPTTPTLLRHTSHPVQGSRTAFRNQTVILNVNQTLTESLNQSVNRNVNQTPAKQSNQSTTVNQTPVRQTSKTNGGDPWMSARKPQSASPGISARGYQKLAERPEERKSEDHERVSLNSDKGDKLTGTPKKSSQEPVESKSSGDIRPENERGSAGQHSVPATVSENKSRDPLTDTTAKDSFHGVENNISNNNTTQKFTSIQSVQNQVSLIPTSSLKIVLEKIDENPASRSKSSPKPYYHSRSRKSKKKVKHRLSVGKRNELREKVENPSQPNVSGSFVSSTQKFAPREETHHSSEGRDPYRFHGTQSQQSPQQGPSASPGQTPLSSRKREKRQHKKPGLKKQRVESADADVQTMPDKPHVTFQTSPQVSSQSSDVTVTTIGSLPSMPSSISQSSPQRETVLSPTSSSGKQSIAEEVGARLPERRISIEQSLTDTLPLSHTEEDNYQKVTVVIERVEQIIRKIVTTKKIIGPNGRILESKQDVQSFDPVVVEETTQKKIKYVYIPSPSRSVSSLTSGDLADISSSLSRSSVSSLGSKISSLTSSLERTTGVKQLETQTSVDQSEAGRRDPSQAEDQHVTKDADSSGPDAVQSMAAPSIIPRARTRTSLTDRSSDSQTGSSGKEQQDIEKQTGSKAGSQLHSPRRENVGLKGSTTTPGQGSDALSKPSTPVVMSDQEASDVVTPLGSTINKTGSYLHSRTTSMESPKASDSLFSTSSDESKKNASTAGAAQPRPGGSGEQFSSNHPEKQPDSSDQVSSEIPYQDQCVSSSGTPEESVAMVTSSGTVGCRVIAKWKDGFYYPGTLKSSADRYAKCQVRFDDGDSLSVKGSEILLIERLPVGQSVMVLTSEEDFEFGLITKSDTEGYTVETDSGAMARYSFSQVILSADQAACILSDQGSGVVLQVPTAAGHPANTGDVSLENLLDTPRRSAKKSAPPVVTVKGECQTSKDDQKGQGQTGKGEGQSIKDDQKVQGGKGEGQTGKGRKRKLDALKPQATSTPTPKGKGESIIGKRRKVGHLTDSPVPGLEASPVAVRKSPRKTRVGLFTSDLGPVPERKLFRNIYFLLTNVDKTKEQQEQEKKLVLELSTDTSAEESEADDEIQVPFDKDHLKSQITAGGGILIDSLDEKLLSTGKRLIVCLSSTYQRTIKYLQCLACGIPCLSHMWVVDSCTKDQLLDETSYLLPAGISLEKKKVMEWRKKTDVFKGINAVVNSKNSKFVESWSQVLKLAKCHVHPQLQYNSVHVIVSDSTCTATVERQAESHGIPIVGTEWVIQCLVNGVIMSYTGHPRYKHDLWS